MLIPVFAFAMLLPQYVTKDNVNKGSRLNSACQAELRLLDQTTRDLEEDSYEGQFCEGYISGINDGLMAEGTSVCTDGAAEGTLIRVYVLYMQQHPKLLDEHLSVGARKAFTEAYPCRAKR